jgi:5-formyltetrahydrofolate cyclo-ligase
MNPEQKPRLRNQLRLRRRRLAAYKQQLAGQSLKRRILANVDLQRHTRKIAFYLPADGEISLLPVLQWCLSRNMHCYLPVLDRNGLNRLDFVRYRMHTKMIHNRFGILEPVTTSAVRIDCNQLDVIFMPTVGFDAVGRRLGMGGGFYDRTLAECRHNRTGTPLLVAVAHDIQYISRLPEEPWDIHPDLTLTPTRVIRSDTR